MNKKVLILILLFIIAAFEGFHISNKSRNIGDDEYEKAFQHSNKIFGIVLPENAEFCGENTPLGYYYVREGLDRELTVNSYLHSSTILLLKNSKRYFDIITPILKQNGIPEDFKYIAMAESGFRLNVSPRGAAGIWQFMPETAKQYGLEINDDVDERYHLEKSTQAACKMFKRLYNMFGSWTLTAAAYNIGENRIKREVEQQGTTDYYSMQLPEETRRYVYRVITMKFIYENPSKFGFYIRNKDMYPSIPSYNVSIDSAVTSLIDFAKYHEVNYLVFKDLNPWLRTRKLDNNDKKTYSIKLPKDKTYNYNNLMLSLQNPENILNANDSISLE